MLVGKLVEACQTMTASCAGTDGDALLTMTFYTAMSIPMLLLFPMKSASISASAKVEIHRISLISVGEELMETGEDYLGFDAIVSWGACVFEPFALDDDVVTYCDWWGTPYENRCSSAWFVAYISRVEDCEDMGGTWEYPSLDKATCESSGVIDIYFQYFLVMLVWMLGIGSE
jgi:hypothetical protein